MKDLQLGASDVWHFEGASQRVGQEGNAFGCGEFSDVLECLFVCLPVFRGGLAECDFPFLVFAGFDLRLIVEDCLLLGVEGFVVAVEDVVV